MKYDDLLAEVEEWNKSSWPDTMPMIGENFEACGDVESLVKRLAAAIRDLQQHVPLEGWEVEKYRCKNGKGSVQYRSLARENSLWRPILQNGQYLTARPTAAAAMAAIEETT